jgi:hypothetical protein
LLERAGFSVTTTYTVDHAVAMCVNREYAAVVLDQDLFIEVDGWNVAQSLKLVRPSLCVILILRGTAVGKRGPKGVDIRVSQQQISRLPKLIEVLRRSTAQAV